MTDTPDEKSTAIDESELAKKLVATDTVTQEADAPDVEAAEAEAADAEPDGRAPSRPTPRPPRHRNASASTGRGSPRSACFPHSR